jgi:hypothetical protein
MPTGPHTPANGHVAADSGVAPDAPPSHSEAAEAGVGSATPCDAAHTRRIVVNQAIARPGACRAGFYNVTEPKIIGVLTNPDNCGFIITGLRVGLANLELRDRGQKETYPPDEVWCFEVTEK